MSLLLERSMMFKTKVRQLTVSGNGFIQFRGVLNADVPDAVFYGACQQSGTPTPTSPIPINVNDSVWSLNDGTVDLTDIELLGLGDVRDTYNPITGELHRRIGRIVMGEEGAGPWSKVHSIHNTVANDVFCTETPSGEGTYRHMSQSCLCTHFPVDSAYYDNNVGMFVHENTYYGPAFRIPYSLFGIVKGQKTEAELVQLANNWFKERYDSGEPVVFYYVLYNDTTEYIAPQTIRQVKGTNLLQQISGSAQNTYASVTYYGR